MNKKVLITGSNGFVGSHVVESLINSDFLTYAGVRKTSNTKYLKDPRTNFFYFSFDEEDNLREQLRTHKFDYIILNAGVTIANNKEQYFKINAGYTRKFCKILVEEKVIPKKLVFISSLASHGPAEYQATQILDKNAVPHPVTWYGESKLQAEQFIQSFTQIPSLIFRPTAVYGPRDTAMLEVYKTIKRGIEPKIGFGTQGQTFIHVKDLADLIVASLDNNVVNKAYFVGDGTEYPSEVLNGIIKEKLGVKTLKITIPIPIMKMIAFLSEMIGKVKGEVPLLNSNKVKEYFTRSFAIDTSELKNDFNFAPAYDLKSGMEETLDWYIEQKLL